MRLVILILHQIAWDSERLQYAYPWQDLIDQGLKIVAGSDAPVELGDPRIEFYAAITRARLDGSRGEGWHPEFAVSRADALAHVYCMAGLQRFSGR